MTRRLARSFALALALAAGLTWNQPAGSAQLPPQLKAAATVDGEVIRVGDLWDNAGDKAETPIANAPAPGKRVTLEARWLGQVASAYGLDWRPANAFERAVVERNGQTIDSRAIETEVKEALRLEGAPANSSVEITNRAQLSMIVPTGVTPTIGVREVIYDPRMNRFQAVVEVPAGSPAASRVKVTGNVFVSARIPVLARPMGRGETITEADVQWIDVREEVLRRDIISSSRQLVGQEPRYQLRAGAPVRTAEVQKPVTVAKNSPVTMMVRTKFMTLTAQGRAAEDGSAGDVIRVTNIQSKQTVDARVDGPGQVTVIPGTMRAQAAN